MSYAETEQHEVADSVLQAWAMNAGNRRPTTAAYNAVGTTGHDMQSSCELSDFNG